MVTQPSSLCTCIYAKAISKTSACKLFKMTNLRSSLLLCIVLNVLTLITASIALEQHSPNDEYGPTERDATIDALVERLTDRDTTIDALMKHLSDRDAAINVFVKRLTDQDATINTLEHRVKSLEERDRQQQADITKLRTQFQVEKDKTSILKTFVGRSKNTRRMLENVLSTSKLSDNSNLCTEHSLNHKTTLLHRIRRAENELQVAFFSTLTYNQLHVGPNTPILFDHVITNIGNAYHSHLGTFIAPTSGTFVFSSTLLTWDQAASYTISKNGVGVSHIYCYSVNSHYESSSMTVIMQLIKNDDITIRNDGQNINTHGNHYSSFSGYLLHQQYAAIVG